MTYIGVSLAINNIRKILEAIPITFSLFIPSGSDRLITSDGNVLKVREN